MAVFHGTDLARELLGIFGFIITDDQFVLLVLFLGYM